MITVIGGIFDGTLPSYKALDPTFILKSLIQGGIHFGQNTALGILKGPGHWNKKRKDLSHLTKTILGDIKENPAEQVRWLGGVARKTLDVGSHLIRCPFEKRK